MDNNNFNQPNYDGQNAYQQNQQGQFQQGQYQQNQQGQYQQNQQGQFQQNPQYGYNNPQGSGDGHGLAVASLVLGIVSIVFWFFGAGSIVGLISGVIGLVCASSAKKRGTEGGIQTAGFVCSLIGVIGSSLIFVACIACVGALGTAEMFTY
ncbi:MAG: DUF4190 domain-containing protein [Lachnospiraceae bacterium]|nr:DUF4190 domain-containing protein [Lachnospiraceae bacterium]